VSACPVCENPQPAGDECEVCGRSLLGPQAAAEATVEPMEGLETTAQGEATAAVEVALLPELEPTLQPAAGAVPAETVPEFEATLAERVEAPVDAVPDLQPTAAGASGDPRTVLPLFPTCRYCRTPAGPGERLCARCGMQLAGLLPPAPLAAGSGPRLCSCGTPITRSTCPACGARNKTE
jgi:hypothetical protein